MEKIQELLRVEQQAQAMKEQGEEYYQKTLEKIQQDKESARAQIAQRAEYYIATVADKEQEFMQKETEKINALTLHAEEMLRLEYEKNREKWTKELFDICKSTRGGGAHDLR